jgi:hypothetical protein
VMYTNCAFDFGSNTCECSGSSICSLKRCKQDKATCDTQACPASYCKDGVIFTNCTASATNAGCSCAQVPCRSQQCNDDGWTCK